MNNLVLVDAEGVEGAEARERDRQLARSISLSLARARGSE